MAEKKRDANCRRKIRLLAFCVELYFLPLGALVSHSTNSFVKKVNTRF